MTAATAGLTPASGFFLTGDRSRGWTSELLLLTPLPLLELLLLSSTPEAENLGVVLAARLPVVDRNLSETLLDAVIDDVLHRDGRGRRRVVLVAVAPPVNPPLVFLEVGLLPELVAALAAAERPLSVFRADLVSLQGRLVREDDAAADALEGIGRRRRRPGIGLF